MRRATLQSRRRRMHLRRWRRSPLRMLWANIKALSAFVVEWVMAQWLAALVAIIVGFLFFAVAAKMNTITPRSEHPIWDELTEPPVQTRNMSSRPEGVQKDSTHLIQKSVRVP